MSRNLDYIVETIESKLKEDPVSGAALLVEFSMEHSANNKLIHRALVLKMNLIKAETSAEKARLVYEMSELASRISREAKSIKDEIQGKDPMLLQPRSSKQLSRMKTSNVVAQARNISKTFRRSGFYLNDISASFRLGKITGVVGENGNGKTTLFRILVGDLAADSGLLEYPYIQDSARLLLSSGEISQTGWNIIKQNVAFIPQELERWYGTVRENLHYELANHGVNGQKNNDEVDYIIYRLGLSDHQFKTRNQLSGGFRLRFALAKALIWKPKFLVIDEPLANLDIKAQLVILNDLRDLANSFRNPIAIVISSQHLHEIENVSDKLIFLKNGEMVFNGRLDELGKEREENTYEFSCSHSYEELEKILAGLNYYSLEHTGLAFVLQTPLSIDQKQVLRKLLDEEVELEYFRNISQSAKKMFI